jgi:hypothetical protein
LNPTQAQFLDGVRVAIEMIDVAYENLSQQLRDLCPNAPVNIGQRGVTSAPAFLSAWSIIDNAHRLRGLVENFPRLAKKQHVAEFRLFVEQAVAVEELRHAVQHMESAIRKSAPQGRAVWGSLSWMFRTDHENVLSCVLTVGALMPAAELGSVTLAAVGQGVDHVSLRLGSTSVSLTDLIGIVKRLALFVESALAEGFKQSAAPPAESDYFIAIAMKCGPNNTFVIPATGSENSA